LDLISLRIGKYEPHEKETVFHRKKLQKNNILFAQFTILERGGGGIVRSMNFILHE
jgi:hypothetical protein